MTLPDDGGYSKLAPSTMEFERPRAGPSGIGRVTALLSRAVTLPSPLGHASRSNCALFVVLNHRVCRMIVNRLKILRLDDIGLDALVLVERHGDISHRVLDELRIVVGALGDVFLVRPLQYSVDLARGFALGNIDQFFQPHVLGKLSRQGNVGALI